MILKGMIDDITISNDTFITLTKESRSYIQV